jgi:hypothetical protein
MSRVKTAACLKVWPDENGNLDSLKDLTHDRDVILPTQHMRWWNVQQRPLSRGGGPALGGDIWAQQHTYQGPREEGVVVVIQIAAKGGRQGGGRDGERVNNSLTRWRPCFKSRQEGRASRCTGRGGGGRDSTIIHQMVEVYSPGGRGANPGGVGRGDDVQPHLVQVCW